MAALAGGVVLASDVFESGAAVDRLLFGTLLGLETADLALSAVTVALAVVASLTLGRTWAAIAFDPDGASALGLPAAAPTSCCSRSWRRGRGCAIPAVGALLVAAVYVLPAAAARLVARSIPALLAWSLGLALAEGLRRAVRAPTGSTCRPGRRSPCSGPLTYAVVALGTGVREARLGAATHDRRGRWPRACRAGYGGEPVLQRRVVRGRSGPDRVRARARTAAARPRSSAP